jgi:hypothetical protein
VPEEKRRHANGPVEAASCRWLVKECPKKNAAMQSNRRSVELVAEFQGKTSICKSRGATVSAVESDLEQIAADLRSQLTADECRRMAELLVVESPR